MNEDKGSLLIVDDNVTNLDLLSRYMSQNGYVVSTAESGKHAIELLLLEKKSFDTVLLDLFLPDITGREILIELRKSFSLSELPVIILTAKQENDISIDLLQLGANDYVIKPIDQNILKARVATQVKLKRVQKAYKDINENLESLVERRTDELKQTNLTLNNNRKRFQYLLSSSPAITYATSIDKKHKCNFVSENISDILGYYPSQMIEDPDFWYTHVYSKDKERVLKDIDKNISKGVGSVEYRFLHKNGKYCWVHDQHRIIYDENNKPVEIIGTWANISKEHELQEALDYQAIHDDLTGLINRREFEKCLEQVLGNTASDTVQHVVCYMDIDQFKVINNTYSHVAGNEILRQISGILQDTISRSDTLAYLGGDEFGILLKYCTLNQARRTIENLQDKIKEFRFIWEDKKLVITASIGVVPFNKYLGSPANVLSNANAACYDAKEAGRNRVFFYSESTKNLEQKQHEMQWVERINLALEEDRFLLYFQPIIPLNGGQEQHFELLIRMKDEMGKLIPPGAFLPAAEKYNLSSKIDHWVIQTTLSWLDAYQDLLEDNSSWGINLSGQSLSNENLLQFVIEELDRKQIPAHKVYFEITETAAIANMNNATQFINALRNHGCEFALDDFGSGLSSFSYLKNLPVDYIKIDGMFVKNITSNKIDCAMVKAINDISHIMNKKTIAEFVEDDEIIEILKNIGVDYAQGFGICKPQPINNFMEYKNTTSTRIHVNN